MTAPAAVAATGAGERILVVEDSATQAAALAVLLERAGYTTAVARRAERALELLGEGAVDLVLSDVVMPGMDGYELCRRIKAEPRWQRTPVVLLTSLTDPLAIVRGLASGADHYVTKPYDADGLLARVRYVLDHRDDPEPVQPSPVEIELLGTRFTIRATKEAILELLVSSYSDLVRTSEIVRDTGQRARFLADATERLSSTLDAREVLTLLTRLVVPRIADLCSAYLVGPDGERRRVATSHAIAGAPAIEPAELVERSALVDEVVADRQPRVVPLPDDESLALASTDPAALAVLRGRGAQDMIVVPLVARTRVLGILRCAVLSSTRQARGDEMPLILDLARNAAVALDNALLYEQAQRATRARDDVLAIVSHDLRNPLNTIQMSTSFLLETLPDAESKPVAIIPQLQVMQRATRRANALIQDLLDVSRIDAGTLKMALAPVEASLLVRDAALELEPLVTAKQLAFEHEWVGPDAMLAADRSRVGQIFSNLVGNAIKFTPAGGTVRIEGSRKGEVAEYCVSDTGAGIPAEQMPRLFDRFWQASQTSRSGAGLGLFIVKGIVEAHGGAIHVESEIGRGTGFRFTVPMLISGEGDRA